MPENSIHLPFTTLTIHPVYAISEPHFGIHLDIEEAELIFSTLDAIFTTPYGLISLRTHDFSINPMAHRQVIPRHEKVGAVAIVAQNERAFNAAKNEISYSFNRKPFGLFRSLEQAQDWILSSIFDLTTSTATPGYPFPRLPR